MIKKVNSILFLFLLIMTVSSCYGGKNMQETDKEYLNLVNNEKNYEELITIEYNINDYFADIYLYGYTLSEVNEKYKIECLRQVDDVYYALFKSKTGGKLFVFFSKNEDEKYVVIRSWYYEKKITKDDFCSLIIGISTLDDVRDIDKFGDEISATSVLSLVSIHFTSDKYYFAIKYEDKEDSFIVTDIKSSKKMSDLFFCNQEDNIFDYILDIDL